MPVPVRSVVPTLVILGLAAATAQAYPPPGRTEQLRLLDTSGEPAPAGLVLSGGGRMAAVVTNKRLLAADTNNVADVYAIDLVTRQLELVSVDDDGRVGNGASQSPQLSDDGTVITFQSSAANLVKGDGNGFTDVFVRDRRAGTTRLLSASNAGAPGDGNSFDASISEDGTRVAFLSFATNLVDGDTNLYADIFVRDLALGRISRVSVLDDGSQQMTNAAEPAISGDGRSVAYVTAFPVVATDTNAPARDVYVHDLVTRTNERISVSNGGDGGMLASFYPSLSDDGRYVAFSSFNPDFTGYDTNGYSESFVRDRQAGTTQRLTAPTGEQGNGVIGIPVISGDGRFVTGNFLPTNLGWEDTNGSTDVYRYDRLTGEIDLASRTPAGIAGDKISYGPTMSNDGSLIAFASQATNLLDEAPGSGPYLRHMGPAVGTGAVTARRAGDGVAVDGWVRAAGAAFGRTGDPATDALPGTQHNGGELTGADFVFRPEADDVLVRVGLAPWPHPWPPLVGTTAPKPNVMSYAIDLEVDGATRRIVATTGPTGQTFAGFECAAACTKVADLRGGVWTRSDDVLVSVPLGTLGLQPGARIEGGRVRVSAGEDGPALDTLALGPATVPAVSVSVAAVPAGATPAAADYTAVTAFGGRLGTTLAAGADAAELWTRTCVAGDCATTVAPIED